MCSFVHFPYLGLVGGAEFIEKLFLFGEIIATNEDQNVSRKGVEAIQKIVIEIEQEHLIPFLLPIIKKMIENGRFRTRALACVVLTFCYPRLEELEQSYLLNVFLRLCEDECRPL